MKPGFIATEVMEEDETLAEQKRTDGIYLSHASLVE